MIHRFDDFVLDTDSFELQRGMDTVAVEPQVFDLLVLLCENPDRVVSREEVMDAVWGTRIVTDATISTAIRSARRAIGDNGKEQSYIRTVRGRGFRFVGGVTSGGPLAELDGTPAPIRRDAAGEVVLAVLPLTVLSEDHELGYFADGLVEDLTTIIARMSSLTVISRSSAFRYKGELPTIDRVRSELGATHAVTGSVRPLGEVARISVQLVETAGGDHLWAERFDRPVARLFELQDEIILAVSRLLEPRLMRETFARLPPARSDDDARATYRRADGLLAVRGWHGDTFGAAAGLLRRAVQLDPAYARAHALLALVLGFGQRIGLAPDREGTMADSLASADAALALDDRDPTVLGHAGCALADIGQVERGQRLLERAIELDPSNAQAWAALGGAKLLQGRYDDAAEDLRHGIRISPLDNRLSVWGTMLSLALALAGDVGGALAEIDDAYRRDPRNYMAPVVRAALLVTADRADDARLAMDDAVGRRPGLSRPEVHAIVGPELFRALQRAGLVRDLARAPSGATL